MPKAVTVRLVGGLGNQLFGYYAGAALAAHTGGRLRLDTSWTRFGMTDHGIEILKFDLPGQWVENHGEGGRFLSPGTIPSRAWAKALRELPALRKLLRVYEAPGVGHDANLLAQRPGTKLRGYFQSWEIVEFAVGAGYPRRPQLRKGSDWLSQMIDRAHREHPVAVHVRRGDYTKVSEFGLLGPSYYERAVQRLRELGIAGPIWLFSDDPSIAMSALGAYGDGAEVAASPDGPASEMLAMSYAAAHVIANSTFSWWGARMSGDSGPVVAPTPWFTAGPEIEGLIPPSWMQVER